MTLMTLMKQKEPKEPKRRIALIMNVLFYFCGLCIGGGIGTFDEFFQILTLTELGRSAKPIIVYNVSGFYDDTIAIIDKLIGMGFIRESVKSLFSVCETPEEVLNAVEWLTSQ